MAVLPGRSCAATAQLGLSAQTGPRSGCTWKKPKTQSLDPTYCSPGTGEISQGKETSSKPHVGKRCPAPGPQRGAKHVGWVLNPATAPRDAGRLPKFSPTGWLPASLPEEHAWRLCLRLQIGANEAKVIILGILRTGGEEQRRPGWAAHERAAWSLRAAGHLHAPNRPGRPQKHQGWGSHAAPPRQHWGEPSAFGKYHKPAFQRGKEKKKNKSIKLN